MRLINGVDLHTLIDEGPLEPKRAVAVIDQIASALHNAHQVGWCTATSSRRTSLWTRTIMRI